MPNSESLNESRPLSFFRGNARKIKLRTANARGHDTLGHVPISYPEVVVVNNKTYFLYVERLEMSFLGRLLSTPRLTRKRGPVISITNHIPLAPIVPPDIVWLTNCPPPNSYLKLLGITNSLRQVASIALTHDFMSGELSSHRPIKLLGCRSKIERFCIPNFLPNAWESYLVHHRSTVSYAHSMAFSRQNRNNWHRLTPRFLPVPNEAWIGDMFHTLDPI
jgi:hypothetical protein